MPRSAVPFAARVHLPLLLMLALSLAPALVRAEAGGAPELAPGQSAERRAPQLTRETRVRAWRELARAQAAELDSLAALPAATVEAAGRRQRDIEAAKQRHAREEIALQREFALRTGNLALARRLALRLERLDVATGGAR